MRHLFNYPLGACSAPFGFSKKEIGVTGALLLGSGISAAASVGSAAMNNYAADLRSDRQFYRTQDLMQMQKNLNMQQWQEQQEYNSPAAQMQRYREAGLNPWLMSKSDLIGSGSSPAAAPSTSAPSVPLGEYAPIDMSQLGGNVAQLLGLSSQIKKADSEAFANIVKALPELGKTIGWDNVDKVAYNMLGMMGVSNSQYKEQMDSILEGYRIQNARNQLQLDIETMYGKDKAALINQNLIFEGQSIVAEINKMYSEKRLNDQSVKELITRSAKNLAEKAHLDADTETINQMRQFLVKSAEMQASMDTYDKIEAETDFIQGTEARAWQRSPEGRMAAAAAQTVDDNGETNLVNKIVHGRKNARRKYRGK